MLVALGGCPPTRFYASYPHTTTGLFLKGVGLSLEDALRFWEQEFTKIMTADVFNKQVGSAPFTDMIPPELATLLTHTTQHNTYAVRLLGAALLREGGPPQGLHPL